MAYEPELGQMVSSWWLSRELPEYAKAIVLHLLKEFERVAHNLQNWVQEDYTELTIAGVEYRPYYWGDDEDEQCKPNFKFGDVLISWYKHPGRGMSTNVGYSEVEWIKWMDVCLLTLRRHEYDSRKHPKGLYTKEYRKYLGREEGDNKD